MKELPTCRKQLEQQWKLQKRRLDEVEDIVREMDCNCDLNFCCEKHRLIHSLGYYE